MYYFIESEEKPVERQGCKTTGLARGVLTAVNRGLMKGFNDDTLRPQGRATRVEAANVIMNLMNKTI